MTEQQSLDRGLKFGLDNIFGSDGGKDLGKLGQGIHALQDAIAHREASTNNHLGWNASSFGNFIMICMDQLRLHPISQDLHF